MARFERGEWVVGFNAQHKLRKGGASPQISVLAPVKFHAAPCRPAAIRLCKCRLVTGRSDEGLPCPRYLNLLSDCTISNGQWVALFYYSLDCQTRSSSEICILDGTTRLRLVPLLSLPCPSSRLQPPGNRSAPLVTQVSKPSMPVLPNGAWRPAMGCDMLAVKVGLTGHNGEPWLVWAPVGFSPTATMLQRCWT